jgi:hypothetical protein
MTRYMLSVGNSNFPTDNFVHTYSGIDSTHNPNASAGSCTAAGNPNCYPGGADLFLTTYGSADHVYQVCAWEVTSSTTVSPGTGTVTVDRPTECGRVSLAAPTSGFAFPAGTAPLAVCGTTSCDSAVDPTAESITYLNYSISTSTTLTITFTKNHTAPYKIRQQGGHILQTSSILINNDPTGGQIGMSITDSVGHMLLWFPNKTSNNFPYGSIRFRSVITGDESGQNLTFRQFSARSLFRVMRHDNLATVFQVDDDGIVTALANLRAATLNISGNAFITGNVNGGAYTSPNPNAAASGIVRLAQADTICFRDSENTGDTCLKAPPNTAPATVTIATGTWILNGGTIAPGSCANSASTSASRVSATDTISWAYAALPEPTTDGLLTLSAWPTAGNVNFVLCNPTARSINSSGLAVNWRVVR